MIKPFLLIAATVTTLGVLNAHAESYGLHFLGTTTDPVTGTAGVFPIGNWNNYGVNPTATPTVNAVNNSAGMLSTTTLTISGPGAQNGYRTTGNAALTGGNASLENGYFDAGGIGGQAATGTGATAVTFTLTGLTSAAYNIYIYDAGDNARPGNIGDGLPDYTINGTDYFTAILGGAFTTFTQGQTQSTELSAVPSTLTPGNYILVSGVVPTAGGTITITANNDNRTFRSPVDGIELVGVVPEPSTYALVALGLGGFVLVRRVRRASV